MTDQPDWLYRARRASTALDSAVRQLQIAAELVAEEYQEPSILAIGSQVTEALGKLESLIDAEARR